MQSFENHLVLLSDLHKLSFAGFSIKALSRSHMTCLRLLLHLTFLFQVGETGWTVCVRYSFRVLQDVGHLFEQDPVLSLDFCVPFYMPKKLEAIN